MWKIEICLCGLHHCSMLEPRSRCVVAQEATEPGLKQGAMMQPRTNMATVTGLWGVAPL